MFRSKMNEYHLLASQNFPENKRIFPNGDTDNDDPEHDEHGNSLRFEAKRFSVLRELWTKHSLMVLLATSIMANLLFGILSLIPLNSLKARTNIRPSPPDVSLYVGLGRDPDVRFPWSTGYGPEVTNHSLADERWEALDINAGIVAIPDEWAAEHNLPPTQRFPWDTTKGIYTLSAFHTLHCLKDIHRLLYDAHHGRPLSRDVGHAMHCVDHMRKDAVCNADDFPLPTPPDHYGMEGPRGQARVCRDWDALLAWTDQHNACYQHMTADFAANHKEIERYRNCPKDSPYLKAMNEYFGSE